MYKKRSAPGHFRTERFSFEYTKFRSHKMKIIAFDLDDTLLKEREFCESGFRAVARILKDRLSPAEVVNVMTQALRQRQNHYDALENLASSRSVRLDMTEIVNTCRNHIPVFRDETVASARNRIGKVIERGYIPAIITDGRSVTQRNKIKALGLTDMIAPEDIMISSEQGADKKSDLMFRRLMALHHDIREFVYIGDNVEKDFYWPKKLGWKTIGIRDTENINIHPQNLNVSKDFLPDIWLEQLRK